jgi:uncharacterized protein (TIGR04255 family)
VVERPSDLPDYENPPIDEVAIGVQFPPISGMYDAHVGLYWQKIRGDYPRAESQPRVESPIEAASLSASQPLVPIQFPMSVPTQGRTFLIAEEDDYLIQVQNTRFIQNWRRREAAYEHFEEIWDLFESHYRTFKELLTNEGLAAPRVQQVEVTYINWIVDLPPSKFLKPATQSALSAYGRVLEPEDLGLNARYRLDDGTGAVERLYVQGQAVVRASDPSVSGYQLALVHRAANATGLVDEEIRSYAYAGRTVIVNAFTDLTTPLAHEHWSRIQ